MQVADAAKQSFAKGRSQAGAWEREFVVGPSLIVGAALSMLRQTNVLSIDTEVPLLTITIGGLWTLAHVLPLPRPAWIIGD